MADSTSSSVPNAIYLLKQVKIHEVAIAELNGLSSSRPVYQKNANIYFRTSIQKATASEQKHLELVKRKLEQLNAT